MEEDVSFRKVFLITLIVAFCISALIGIVLIVAGEFNEVTVKILLTTASVGAFSLLGLCNSILLERKRFSIIPIAGILVSSVSFIIALILIWGSFNHGIGFLKFCWVLLVLSITFAHCSLLLLIQSDKPSVNISLSLTLLFISLVAIEAIILVLVEPRNTEGWLRLLGVFAILDVLGTICTPIIHKVTKLHESSN